jgi:hypothetical protein
MLAYDFHTAGNDDGSEAIEGLEGTARRSPALARVPPSTLNFRAHLERGGERQLLDRLQTYLGGFAPRSLLTSYYVSLKTNPFVVITGRAGGGKAAFVDRFATALLGAGNDQFVTIGSGEWAQRSTQRHYYRGIYERFGSARFLDTLHEAALPEHAGKLYLVLLKGMSLDELRFYFTDVLHVGPDGSRHLALMGLSPERRPLLPPNIFITATLHTPRVASGFDERVWRRAGRIDLEPQGESSTTQLPDAPQSPAPVGYQRLVLAGAIHDPAEALVRLEQILGRQLAAQLGPSRELSDLLYQNGMLIAPAILSDIAVYVANSFDRDGCGLFDQYDALRNAQIAFDAQLIQRVLWRIGAGGRSDLRRQLTTHLLVRHQSAWA